MPLPFTIDESALFEHTHVIARPGHGKTQLLQHQILEFLNQPNPPALVIIDSQGEMIPKLRQLELFNPINGRLKDRLRVIDPEDVEFPPALNMFDASNKRFHMYSQRIREQLTEGTLELYKYIFGSIASDMTQKQGTAFGFIVELLFRIDGATIRTLRELMEEDPESPNYPRYKPQIENMSEDAKAFFMNQFYHHKSPYRDTKQQMAARLYEILRVPAFSRMFSTKIRKLDMYEELQNRNIVLVNTAKAHLKKDASQLFGRYMIALTLNAALERAAIKDEERQSAFLICDEAHEYFDENTEELLDQIRKYKLGVTLAHQRIEGQVSKSLAAALGNTAVKYCGSLYHADATHMAKDMRCEPELLLSLGKTSAGSQFACFVNNVTKSGPVVVSIPFGTLESQSRMSEYAEELFLKANRARVAVMPDEHIPLRNSQKSAPIPPPSTSSAVAATDPKAESNPEAGKDW